jgi:GWxTD domain-containing protein
MAHLMLVLPPDQRKQLAERPAALLDGDGTLQPGAGGRAARWWRRHDPRPATLRNERLIEHLQRVVRAQRQFGADTFLRYDDRGRIYVRLGAPSQRRMLSSESLAKSVSIRSHFIPRNEYWRYRGLGDHSHYLFVKQGRTYVLGGVTDLLPGGLRHNMSGGGVLATLAMRDLYDVFVPRVNAYAPLFDRVSDEVARLRALASRRQTTLARLADSNVDPGTGAARYSRIPPSFYDEARRAERDVAQKREAEVPVSRSQAAAREGGLPVAVRTARFLNDDGSTRLEAYWSVRRDQLETPAIRQQLRRAGYRHAQRYTVRLTTRRYDPSYRVQSVSRSDHRLRARSSPEPPTHLPVRAVQMPGLQEVCHLSLQWDQLAVPQGAPSRMALRAQSFVHWVDSLDVLPPDGKTLVLSDLVPLQAASLQGTDVRDDTGFRARPYPFSMLDPDMRLGVYLEAYHLRFDADDRTRYTVEYTVRREVPREGVAGLFGATRTETTATRMTNRGRSQTAAEYLEVDLSDFKDATALVLIVRVTDAVTGASAHRVLPFRVDDGLL